MSDRKKTSLLGNLWHGAVVILGSVVVLWIAATLLLQIWWILLIAAAITCALWIGLRRWLTRNRL